MLAEGLIEESARRPGAGKEDERRRYFRITKLGSDVAAAEMHRLETVLLDARSKRFATRSR
jgi:hypothetical protein